jgi:hypothetical protein
MARATQTTTKFPAGALKAKGDLVMEAMRLMLKEFFIRLECLRFESQI